MIPIISVMTSLAGVELDDSLGVAHLQETWHSVKRIQIERWKLSGY